MNAPSHPPTSSGHSPPSAVLSDAAQAQQAQRGEEQEGEGEGKLWQPFYIAAWNQAEMQNHAVKMQLCVTSSLRCKSKSDSGGCIVTPVFLQPVLMVTASPPSFFFILILYHSLCLANMLALHNMSCLHCWANVCVCVCESSFTHPLGPGLCPCVKRQSLLGGFCCEDNVGCNINGMFHCGNRESFLRRNFRLNRCCFVADTSVCGSVYLSVIHKDFSSVRLKKGSQMATNMCIAKGSILFQKLQMSTQTQ